MTTGKRIVISVIAGFVPMLMWAHKSGADPRHTAAPGEDVLACATAGCHTSSPTGGPLNVFGGSVNAEFSSSSYTPGQIINITVSISDPVNSVWHGFQMSSRLDSTNAQAGTFTTGPGSVVFCDNGTTEGVPRLKTCPNNQVEYITHSEPATGTWTFKWTAPATDSGPVRFYLAGNAVNHDDHEDGNDHIYTRGYVLQPVTVCTLSLPTITKVVSARGFGGLNLFTSGSYLEITGSNLAGTSREWQGFDFNGSNAPTSLDGVSVSINGKPGFLSYISPTQINVQAPADTFTGPVGITVTNCSGTSAASTLTRATIAPGLLAPPADLNPAFTVGGKQFLVATFLTQYLFVGNLNPPLFKPAKPNDIIWLYGIGLGDTTPAIAPGVIATGLELVNAPVTVKFGQTTASAGRPFLYPTFVGLYALAVTVPNVADGDYQINVTVGGQALQQPPFYLTVHK
jgi:uncharacterized protein (TIGR03437 family)